jgi:hypothetical protein
MAKETEKYPDLYLHCKCEECALWKVSYDQLMKKYKLVCKTCKGEVEVDMEFENEPHAKIHWDSKK